MCIYRDPGILLKPSDFISKKAAFEQKQKEEFEQKAKERMEEEKRRV